MDAKKYFFYRNIGLIIPFNRSGQLANQMAQDAVAKARLKAARRPPPIDLTHYDKAGIKPSKKAKNKP